MTIMHVIVLTQASVLEIRQAEVLELFAINIQGLEQVLVRVVVEFGHCEVYKLSIGVCLLRKIKDKND